MSIRKLYEQTKQLVTEIGGTFNKPNFGEMSVTCGSDIIDFSFTYNANSLFIVLTANRISTLESVLFPKLLPLFEDCASRLQADLLFIGGSSCVFPFFHSQGLFYSNLRNGVYKEYLPLSYTRVCEEIIPRIQESVLKLERIHPLYDITSSPYSPFETYHHMYYNGGEGKLDCFHHREGTFLHFRSENDSKMFELSSLEELSTLGCPALMEFIEKKHRITNLFQYPTHFYLKWSDFCYYFLINPLYTLLCTHYTPQEIEEKAAISVKQPQRAHGSYITQHQVYFFKLTGFDDGFAVIFNNESKSHLNKLFSNHDMDRAKAYYETYVAEIMLQELSEQTKKFLTL